MMAEVGKFLYTFFSHSLFEWYRVEWEWKNIIAFSGVRSSWWLLAVPLSRHRCYPATISATVRSQFSFLLSICAQIYSDKTFQFSPLSLSHSTASKHKAKSQSEEKTLCNFQQIEFLFLFDGDYSVTFPLLYCSLIFISSWRWDSGKMTWLERVLLWLFWRGSAWYWSAFLLEKCGRFLEYFYCGIFVNWKLRVE